MTDTDTRIKLPPRLGPFEAPDWQDDASILAHVDYFGVNHHVLLLRVHEDETGLQEIDATEDDDAECARGQWLDACGLYEDVFQTIDLSEFGLRGEWVIVIHPYGQ